MHSFANRPKIASLLCLSLLFPSVFDVIPLSYEVILNLNINVNKCTLLLGKQIGIAQHVSTLRVSLE